jgi:predicted ATPase/DNA-binding SARP family transcriptional activator
VNQIRIELFDGIRLRCGERVVTRFGTRKTAALLAYLAYFRDREHPREVLIEMLWPESDPEAGRKSLGVALTALRRELEPEAADRGRVLRTDRFAVQLDPGAVTTDAAEFQAAAAAAERAGSDGERLRLLRTAAAVYSGQLLPGFYDEWVVREQERLASIADRALTRLARLLEQGGDLRGAIEQTRRRVELNPLREEAHRELIRLHAAADQLPLALRQFGELERILREELDTAPSAATRALVEELRAAPSAKAPGCPHSHPNGNRPKREMKLPARWTAFFGREGEQSWLRETLAPGGSRLVTLTGPGGCGKTRLALEAAAAAAPAFHAAVWFVPLADIRDAQRIPDRIAAAMGLSGPQELGPIDRLARGLSGFPALVVLDNFEHLLTFFTTETSGEDYGGVGVWECGSAGVSRCGGMGAGRPYSHTPPHRHRRPEAVDGAGVLRELLERLPSLTCLVTSRQRLGLEGERELTLAPLAVPEGNETVPELSRNESARLFVDRVRSVQPRFAVTAENRDALVRLCRRLEGLPLALELAAARAHVLSPGQIADQLEAGFGLLEARHRDAEPRHRSLEAAIEWSYRLLPPDLQRFFTRLSVFRGGWPLEAAAAVAAEHHPTTLPPHHHATLDCLCRLRESSLIVAEEVDGEMRYRMLEMLREYAAAHLEPAAAAEVRRRHLEWLLSLAEELHGNPHGEDGLTRLQRLEREADNLWAALQWCRAEPGQAVAGLRLAGAISWFWGRRASAPQILEYLRDLLAREETREPTSWRARALAAAGAYALGLEGDRGARPHFEEALAVGRAIGDVGPTSHALASLGHMALRQGDVVQAARMLEETLALKRGHTEIMGMSLTLMSVGDIARIRGDRATARRRYEESLEFARKHVDQFCIATSMERLAVMEREEGRLETARALLEECMELRRRLAGRGGSVTALLNLALVELRAGDIPAARSLAYQCLALAREDWHRRLRSAVLRGLGRVTEVEGDLLSARSHYLESLQLRADLDDPWGIVECLDGLARVAAAESEPLRAVKLAGPGHLLRERAGVVISPEERDDHERALASCRTALGQEQYEESLAAGRALSIPEAAALAMDGAGCVTGRENALDLRAPLAISSLSRA